MHALDPSPADPNNALIAHTLHWLAVLLEIDEADLSSVRAHRRAAQVVRGLDEPVSQVLAEQGVEGLKRLGLSEPVCALISEWVRLGTLPAIDMSAGGGSGSPLWPTLARTLCQALGIGSPRRVVRKATPERHCATAPRLFLFTKERQLRETKAR